MTAARSVVRPLVRPLVRQLTGGVVAQVISAVIKPAMSPLYHGDALQDVANWETFGEDTNYVPLPGRTIASVVRGYLGDAVDASTALSAGDTAGFTVTATDSEGDVVVFAAFPITVQDVAPAVDAAPSASGDVYEGDNLTGTSGTFTGTNLVEIDEWEVSDDGSTDWTGTGDTDTTSPALVLGKYYRFASTAANSASSVAAYSTALGPVVAAPAVAVISINSITAPDEDGEAAVSYTIDKNDAGVQAVLYLSAEAPPGEADFGGGGDPAYIDLGTVALDTSGAPIDLAIPDELNNIFRLALLPSGGGDADVVVSDAITIDTRTAPANPMADDVGKLYWFGYDNAVRSGTDVTAVNDKGGAAFALTSTPAGFAAPQQADAGSAVAFNAAGPSVIQTATKAAGNRLLQQHFVNGGSARVFIVLDGASIDAFFGAILNESNDHQANLSILFGAGKFGSNLRFYALARQFANAVTINYDSGIPLAGLGTVIVEYLVTQSTWTTYLNGTENSTGAVTAENFPTHGTARTSLGARASDTASADAATCAWREIFTTGTVDETHAANIRAQLAAKYSITLPE